MSDTFPPDAPFSALERAALYPLISALTAEQKQWLGAFIQGTGQVEAVAQALAIGVYYGTESGNSEDLASQLSKRLKKSGHKPKLLNLADLSPKDIDKYEHSLFVISTWGEGDPPEAVVPFFEAIGELPKLDKLKYSVCALGDTSYEQFCETGKQLDAALEKAGATRLADRKDCDVDFDEPFGEWATEVEGVLAALSSGPSVPQVSAAASVASEFGRKNPFPAEVIDKVNLSASGSQKETWHLELSLEGSQFSYEPGDALALIPENDPLLVDEILGLVALDAGETVETPSGEKALRDALIQDFDVTTASKAIVKKLAGLANDVVWTELTADEEKLKVYLRDRQLIDVLSDVPLKNTTPSGFVGALRKLPPRLYSIASSFRAHPDEVHLTIGAVRYQAHDRERKGVASTYCADRIEVGSKVRVYLQPNKNFRLPEDPKTPIIMVGPGTGIAPFRSFIEERAELEGSGDSWLFFGDQRYTYDFLYQLEWQDHLKEGALTKLDVAFSRDQPEKIYVQDRLRENSKEIYDWLQNGAHFYVCGDAERMAGDVHQTLINIISEHGGMNEEQAEAELAALKKSKRYQRDVY